MNRRKHDRLGVKMSDFFVPAFGSVNHVFWQRFHNEGFKSLAIESGE